MKSLIKFLLFLVLTLGLTFGMAELGYSKDPIVLKLGNVQATADIVQTGLKKFADLVGERTKGQIQVQIFPASQLGTEQELLEGVQLGTVHITQNQAVVINEKFYQGLSPEFRKILTKAAFEAGNFQNDLVLKAERADLDRLKEKGMSIVQPDVKAFREATKDVYKKFADKWEPRLYERIQEVK
jgi:TRAP-type C4-dicarboxylate transport system substrate-binding protein